MTLSDKLQAAEVGGRDKWRTMASAPRDGSVFEARCGLYRAIDAYWTGWTFVHNDDEDGEIAYPFTHWKPKTAAILQAKDTGQSGGPS